MFRSLVLVAATLTTGLTAGLFAAFSYAVMPGLARVDDRSFVAAMQQINKAIINGWFAVCFAGALLLTGLALVLQLGRGGGIVPWLGAALVLYLTVLIVTGAVNVPLNDRLAGAGDPDGLTDPAAVRAAFETVWVRWNVVRAVVNTAAFGCLCWALLLAGRAGG